MKRPNYFRERIITEKNKLDINSDDGFVAMMDELLLAPDTVIAKRHMKKAIEIIKRLRNIPTKTAEPCWCGGLHTSEQHQVILSKEPAHE